jgi:hypothetical protein
MGVIYKVRGPRGVYFAIHDPQAGRLWTERSVESARAQAQELKLTIDSERSVTHHELMRLLGRDSAPSPRPASAKSPEAASPSDPKPPARDSSRPIRSSTPFAKDTGTNDVLVTKSDQQPSVFAEGAHVLPNESGQIPITGDILDTRQPIAKKRRDNPFADNKKPRRRS